MNRQLDTLKVVNKEVIFEKANGEKIAMPNLTALLNLYHETTDSAIQERIEKILNEDMGSLLICEIMIDMQNNKTLNRLETGEISKTMGHVGTYNVILESHLEKAKQQFQLLKEQREVEGEFESIIFATLPYGTIIERNKFPQFSNTEYVKAIL